MGLGALCGCPQAYGSRQDLHAQDACQGFSELSCHRVASGRDRDAVLADPEFDATTEWTNVNKSFEAKQELKQIRFELGTFSGDLWMDDVQLLDPMATTLSQKARLKTATWMDGRNLHGTATR